MCLSGVGGHFDAAWLGPALRIQIAGPDTRELSAYVTLCAISGPL